jgi:hypothetical protein
MSKAKRIFFVADTKGLTDRLLLVGLRKQVKGFIRLGHDIQVFSYNNAVLKTTPVRNNRLIDRLYKHRVDDLLVRQIKNYSPDIVFITFAKYLDAQTIKHIREAAPGATLVGLDVDLWPELHDSRVETAAEVDLVFTTYAGEGQQAFKNRGVHCIFMPNMCDPDIERRYEVSDIWKSDILFTGKLRHKNYPTEELRAELISRLSTMKNCTLYGCFGRDFIGGIQYYYAISGARIAMSINAVNNIRLYHSDRLSQYIACGTFVLAKMVPDSNLLFRDGEHLRYFETIEEFFDLAQWYLEHEQERLKIANAGMEWIHQEFNCEKICQYTLEAIENRTYKAPWMANL